MGDDGQAGQLAAAADWVDRWLQLSSRDITTLDVDELEELAHAAFWTGRPRATIEARQRAYRFHRDAKEHARAADAAWRLFHNHFELNETSAASGWLRRAQGHVEHLPDSPEAGYVAIATSMWSAFSGDLDKAVAEAEHALHLGESNGDRDLAAWGLAVRGGMLASRGDVAEGVGCLDDAMLEATSGELSRFVTGWIYCFLLKTCHALGDVARAVEWTDTAVRWCEAAGVNSWYPGVCRLHQCEVSWLKGDWDDAEQQALRAAQELEPFGDYLVAHGQYIAGEVRLHKGQYPGAEEAFQRAHELGSDPQPGLGLLRLAQGNIEGAVGQLSRAVTDGWQPPLPRTRLLAAHVKASLEAGDVESAQSSLAELRTITDGSGSGLMGAVACMAEAEVALAAGDADAALPHLRQAAKVCRDLDFPYEAALVRMAMGQAARQLQDEETATMEFRAAQQAFERLGAAPDAARAAALAGDGGSPALPRGLSDREVEVLRLLADGLSNRDIAEKLVISEHTVRRHLSNIYRKVGVTSRSGATAFAFEHDLA